MYISYRCHGVCWLVVEVPFTDADVAKSLLISISNDIGQIAYLTAKLHQLPRIYFGGYFIRGHPLTMHTITYAINYWSQVSQLSFHPLTHCLVHLLFVSHMTYTYQMMPAELSATLLFPTSYHKLYNILHLIVGKIDFQYTYKGIYRTH